MKYYININSWNLLESFITESLSPFSFYEERNFGNNLKRHMNSSEERTNYIVLSTMDLGGDYSIIVDEELLDQRCITPINTCTGFYAYSKTIYYKKDLISFRVSSKEKLDSIISESKILFEVKCLEKYLDSFVCKSVDFVNSHPGEINGDFLSFEKQGYINSDNLYNLIKGALVGYTRGQMTSSNEKDLELNIKIRSLKNYFTGLHTQIMVNNTFVCDSSIAYSKIEECKTMYLNKDFPKTNLFDILNQQFLEIVKLTKERRGFLEYENNGETDVLENELTNKMLYIQRQIREIEDKFNIVEIRNEYENIKLQEKKNGEQIGKSRLYFKKDSPEYLRKQKLKSKIKNFEESNNEIRELIKLKSTIKAQIRDLRPDTNAVDNLISCIFGRISDIINDITKKICFAGKLNKVNLTDITFNKSSNELSVSRNGDDDEEIEYFNILLNYMLHNHSNEPVSDYQILDILTETAMIFKRSNSYETEKGEKIINCLRSYWLYKNHKTLKFEVPADMPVLQSVMVFFIKPFGFDQMERYMLNKHITDKSYAFMLWGACRGFADLPKTFTELIYNGNNSEEIDRCLFKVLKEMDY